MAESHARLLLPTFPCCCRTGFLPRAPRRMLRSSRNLHVPDGRKKDARSLEGRFPEDAHGTPAGRLRGKLGSARVF